MNQSKTFCVIRNLDGQESMCLVIDIFSMRLHFKSLNEASAREFTYLL